MHYFETLKYVFHVIFHPFDGFWDLKHEKKGSVPAALTFVALTIITLAIEKQDTAFLFNKNKLSELNVLVDIITVALVFILWCVANWCTTSLMDGKGKMVEIVTAIGYAVWISVVDALLWQIIMRSTSRMYFPSQPYLP